MRKLIIILLLFVVIDSRAATNFFNIKDLTWVNRNGTNFAVFSTVPISTDPLVYYKLDRVVPSGLDISGFTNDLVSVTYENLWSSTDGGSAYFNGSSYRMRSPCLIPQQTTTGSSLVCTLMTKVHCQNAAEGRYQWFGSINGDNDTGGVGSGPAFEITSGNTWSLLEPGQFRWDTGIAITTNLTDVCLTCTGQVVTMYVNGVQVAQGNSFNLSTFTVPRLSFGGLGGANLFKGWISDVQYYANYAATSNQILTYHAGTNLANPTVSVPFDAWQATVTNSGTQTGGDGMVAVATTPVFFNDGTNKYFRFNGQYFTNTASFTSTKTQTWDFWARATAINDLAHCAVDLMTTNPVPTHVGGVILGGTSIGYAGCIRMQVGNSGELNYGVSRTETNQWTSSDLNIWRHIKVTYNSDATPTTHIYKDDVDLLLIETNTVSGQLKAGLGVVIGTDADTPGANNYKGDLREIKYYPTIQ